MANRPQSFRPFGIQSKRHAGPRPAWRSLYGRRWAAYAKSFLLANPLCVRCQQSQADSPATVVDHIVPHRGDVALFWDADNHQSLCKRCHDRKTATEDGGFGRNTST